MNGNATSGRVEIFHGGEWGTICDDLFVLNNNAANVICNGLGFMGRHIARRFGRGEGSIRLDDIQCDGTELSIEDCHHAPWKQTDCTHGEDVGVVCGTADENGKCDTGSKRLAHF